jgi:hypothetical protein
MNSALPVINFKQKNGFVYFNEAKGELSNR